MDTEKILNIILKEIYSAPTEDDILKIEDHRNVSGQIIGYTLRTGGISLPESKVKEVIEEAKSLWENNLFQMILKELEYDGAKRMAVEAADWERVRFAKAFIYAADLLRRKIDTLRQLEVKKQKVENRMQK